MSVIGAFLSPPPPPQLTVPADGVPGRAERGDGERVAAGDESNAARGTAVGPLSKALNPSMLQGGMSPA